jgi:hypothetical protein
MQWRANFFANTASTIGALAKMSFKFKRNHFFRTLFLLPPFFSTPITFVLIFTFGNERLEY